MNAIHNIEPISGESNELLKKTCPLQKLNNIPLQVGSDDTFLTDVYR